MGSLYLRGGTWWCKYYVNGQPRRESTGRRKNEKKLAGDFLKGREGAAAQGAPISPRLDRIRYDDLAADLLEYYRTTGKRRVAEVEDRLAYLNGFFAGRRAVSITPVLITQYVVTRQAQPVGSRPGPANRTINIELSLLKRMLRLAYKHGKLLRVPPIEMLKDSPAREGFFEREQFEAVRHRLPADLQVAVTIAHTYGWRMRSEVLNLERRHLDLKAGTLRLDPGSTKNGEGRVVYLTPELRMLLASQLERVEALQRRLGRIVPSLFPHPAGRRPCPRAGTPRRSFAKRWRKVCAAAGVPGRIPHDFRRTAVRNLERAGVARSVAMKITGHKTESVYRRYAIVSDADLMEATTKLMGTIPGTGSTLALDARVVSLQNP